MTSSARRQQPNVFFESDNTVLTHGDAIAFLTSLPADAATIVFLDPPFNLGKRYGDATYPENYSEKRYEKYMRDVISASARALRPGGALYLYHLPYWASRLSRPLQRQLQFRHWIAVSMKNSFVRGDHLYPAHYALLYYTKGAPSSFARPRIDPTLCRWCKRHIHDYGGYAAIVEEKGLNLSDVWADLAPVRHKRYKHRPGNELPVRLTDRVVAISGDQDGLLVDPFVGSGTSLVSGLNAGMRFAGNDLDLSALEVTKKRYEELVSMRGSPAVGVIEPLAATSGPGANN